jgi:uncharacterized membrane protein YkgB
MATPHLEASPLRPRAFATLERSAALHTAALALLRYGVALVLLGFGALKFTGWEAEAIRPLVSHSPFMGWMYALLSVQGVSNVVGTLELAAALLIAARPLSARACAVGSLAAVVIFTTTLTFLFTTPGALAPSGPLFGFLVKDVGFLGAALLSAAEALGAAAREASLVTAHPAQAAR